MGATRPADIVMRPFRSANFAVQARIIVTRCFQQKLGELAMARFISYSGRTAGAYDIYDQCWDALIKAYTYVIGLPFILNYAGDTIFKNKDLKAYFSQWSMCTDYFALREANSWKQVNNSDWTAWRDAILARAGYSKDLYDHFNPRESLANVERYKAARLLELGVSEEMTVQDMTRICTELFRDTSKPEMFFTLQAESCPLASTFIGLDVCVLFSNILLRTIYNNAIIARASREDIPAALEYQHTRVTGQDGFTGKFYFDKASTIHVSVPQTFTAKNRVTLDTYGLKAYVDLSRLPLTQYLTEVWTREDASTPAMTLLIIEPFDLESNEPPAMTQLIVEVWTFETSEPPAMTWLLTENWGLIPPSYTLSKLEQWGKAPPSWTQSLSEPWTS